MKFRQQGNRPDTYNYHLTAREHTPQATRKIHREVNRDSYQYAYLHHLPDLEPATTGSYTTQASRMERGNWADYEGRTRTTRQHLPRIHEQQQTDDPRPRNSHRSGTTGPRGTRETRGTNLAAGERREKGGEIKIERWSSSESP